MTNRIYLLVWLFVSALALPGQTGAPAKAKTKKSAEPKRHPDGRPLGVPNDAVKIGAAQWRRIEDGKPVIYRATAFGHTKLSEEENAKIQRMIEGRPDQDPDVPEGLSVKEVNGKLVFTQITPFGPYTRTKDKNDLTIAERKLWERTQKTSATAEGKP
ncbi:MAG: hypothetical protein NW208_10445 [Bryobacter sp.]|nr:hypothetical protein [Bryobacter sp.]